ncbi:MAG TPA: TonB-dependent receptor [Steroidobacteraceae bacterium]|jgi:iron complex outermembrane receptor protein|nr:TonB-dependent receptor [Steroidobacteraceae bacterium]
MSHRRVKRSRRAARAALMTAVSLDMLAFGLPAAQAAEGDSAKTSEAPLQEVVVTSFRASLESALNRKRQSNQPIESIVPEDIGKMPDQNVAESLQRLPGIQINRAGGKGTQVLIDGLANNLITLNGEVFLTGREFYVSGEASGGGNGGNVQYSSLEGIPSEEIGGIDVIKNPTAADREGGLGGIINLRTRSALAQKDGLNLAANVRGTKATDAEGGVTPNATLVGGYKFDDDFAITAGLSYDDQKLRDKQFQDQNRSQWLITNSAQVGSYTGPSDPTTLTTLPGGQFYIVPQLGYFSDILQQVKTKGATFGLEKRWADFATTKFDYFYVNEQDESFTFSNKVWFNGQGSLPGQPINGIDPTQPFSIDANGVVEFATFMANGAETSTIYQDMHAHSNTFQLSTDFVGDGPWSGDVALSYAKAKSDLQASAADVEHGAYNYSSPAGSGVTSPGAPGCNNGGTTCTDGHGYQFKWSNGGTSGLPSASYPDSFGFTDILSNPAYTTFKSNWAWANFTDEKNQAIKGNLKFAASERVAFTGGLRYAKRDVDQTFGRYLIDGATAGTGGVGAGTAAGNCCIAPGQSGTGIYFSDPGYAAIPFSIAGTPAPGSPGKSNPDLVKYFDSFAVGRIAVKDPNVGGMKDPKTYLNTVWTQAGVPNNTEAFFVDTLSSFAVEEKTTSAYVMGDLGDSADAYHLNLGVRVVRTELTIDNANTTNPTTFFGTASWNGVNSNNAPASHDRSYTDVLPSLNAVYDLTDSQKLRFGAAKVMAPQNLMQLGLGNAFGFTRGADGPNGQARFQFSNGSSGNPELDPFRATQFNLSWEDYFASNAILSAGAFYKKVGNFVTIANIPTLVNDDFGGTIGNVTTPINGGNGKIYGAEISGLYSFANGFGISANYTRSESKSDQDTSFDTDLPIPGVSKNSFNATVYFERFGFSARMAYAWRSRALNSSLVGSTFAFKDQNGENTVYGVYAAPYGQLDGQIGYDFSSQLGVVASVVNLTNEKQHTYLQFENMPFTYSDTGRRYFFGFKLKM